MLEIASVISKRERRGKNEKDIQPLHFSIMRRLEHEFIDDAVRAYGARDKVQCCVRRIREYEVRGVKCRQAFLAYPSPAQVLY